MTERRANVATRREALEHEVAYRRALAEKVRLVSEAAETEKRAAEAKLRKFTLEQELSLIHI